MGDILVLKEAARAPLSNGGSSSSCSASPGAGKRMSLKKMMLFSNYRPKKSQQKSMDRNTNICFKLFSKSINLIDKE